MRLHLGCGKKILEDYTNIDLVSDDPRVIICDIRNLGAIAESNTVQEIYACHVFEHIPRADQIPTLKHWLGILMPGGLCRLSVPDFSYLARKYLDAAMRGEAWWQQIIIDPLVGGFEDGRDDEHNHHHGIFDFAYMKHLMTTAGFVNIRRYDPYEVDHTLKDWSTHKFSLNVASNKPI